MAAIVIVNSEQQMTPGQAGTKRVRGVGTFNSTDGTGTLPIPLEYVMSSQFRPLGALAIDEQLSIVGAPNSLGRINRAADGTITIQRTAPRSLPIPVGTLSATGEKILVMPPYPGTLVGARLCVKTAIAASDATFWTFGLTNKGATDGLGATAMLLATDANTTKATGGSGLTGYLSRNLSLHGTAANLDVAANSVLVLTATKTSTPANLDDATLILNFEFARTSGLQFFYDLEGR